MEEYLCDGCFFADSDFCDDCNPATDAADADFPPFIIEDDEDYADSWFQKD